jgi:tripartite-type tricarboxylate transporter receptor subunit TctC
MAFAEMFEFEEVKYEMDKFSYICRVEVPDRAMVVSNASGFKSIADMQKSTKTIRFASIGANSQNSVESSLIIEAFGLKGKIIPGYKGQPEYMLAVMAGREVDVALGNLANIFENLKKGELTLVSSEGDKRYPAFPKVPFLLETPGIKPGGKKLLEVLTTANGAGRMIIAPPGVPEPRRLFLEQVILNAMKEPVFIDWAKKNELNLSPLPGKESKEMIVKLKELVPKADRAKMKEMTQKYL